MGKLSLQSFFCDALAQLDDANFTVIFWDGRVRQFGAGADFKLHFKTKEVLKNLLADMSLGFGEGYMNGDIEVEGDLRQVVRVGLSSERLEETTRHFLFNIFKLNILQKNNRIEAVGFKSLTEGERVSFDIVQGKKGPAADRVIKL